MKKTLAAVMLVMVGIGIGMTAGPHKAAADLIGFRTSAQMATTPEVFVNGYVAGARDMINLIAMPTGVSDAATMDTVRQAARCLTANASTVGELVAWAKYHWMISAKQYPNDVATSSMIARACE
jgi:hypothetical protein